MDEIKGYLSIITILLGIQTLNAVSDNTSSLFTEVGAALSILVILLVPIFLLGKAVHSKLR
ncbi:MULTISPECIES: hypothetical protein [Halomicrobium]|uniref:Uncharacterized protein n=1 Tax=Halomicrobium mukohataei TaxID=57705 RepID=A0A4D6KCI9_9EURY|nr:MULTISPECIES: hypothetical protein [Halomicrobium]QCD64699.1 hypothetical protein E5139_03215 [Halomicrobium mukohataei]QFR19506.1 hypothetical protein GBQ70_03215 [Halomicrobium sp. ZPS1]